MIKCYKLIFTKNGLKSNIGSYILIIILFIFIISIFIFYFKDFNSLKLQINEIVKIKIDNNNNIDKTNNIKEDKKRDSKNNFIIETIGNNPPKTKTIKYKTNLNITNSKDLISFTIINNIFKDNKNNILNYIDSELNILIYEEAKRLDKRTYFEYYCSLLKLKHLLLFSFYPNNDYNSKIIKIFLFFFFFSLYFFINCLFFNDGMMHQIFEDDGTFNFIYSLPQIIYSSIISTAITNLMKYLSLSEKDLIEIKNVKNLLIIKTKELQTIKCLKIKFALFFCLSFIFLILFWLYLGSFCAVYKNTQVYLIKDTMISFGLSLCYPFVINLFPGVLRILSFKKNNGKCLYLLSRMIQLI